MGTAGVVIWSIIASLLGALLVLAIQESVKYLKSRKGPLTGDWLQTFTDSQTDKQDLVHCRHIGDRLEGTIERLKPADQTYKRWRFEARKRNAMIFGTYWAIDRKNNDGSHGTIQHYLITNSRLEGFYVKLQVATQKGRFVSNLKATRFQWVRRA